MYNSLQCLKFPRQNNIKEITYTNDKKFGITQKF